ncbi:MAG TPA: hypothetical protein VLA68_01960 [Nitrososphaera sp.]|nr:hypothetical protein [Nitrososphaera sp.]
MTTFKFECEDRYEAEKLASLSSVEKDSSIWIAGVSAIVGSEVVLQLKDRSSHAILLKDAEEARRLNRLLTDIVAGKKKILSSSFSGSAAEIHVD